MIKKALVIFSCLFYLLVTAGVHLNLHTCCGSIVSWTLATTENSTEEKHENCCHKPGCCDSHEIHFQIQADQEIPCTFSWMSAAMAERVVDCAVLNESMESPDIKAGGHTKAPPDSFQKPLFIRYHQLLFYA